MKKPSLILEKLTEIIVEVLKKNPQLKLDDQNLTRDKKNIWSIISISYFNTYDYNCSLNIYSWWNRNTQGIKDKVENRLKEISNIHDNIQLQSLTQRKIVISVNPEELFSIKKFIANNKRKKFKSQFDKFLNEKTQKQGLNCWLTCSFNWFKDDRSRKDNSVQAGFFVMFT